MIDDILAFAICGNDSLKVNTFINSKIQMKKFWFGKTKCHKIHLGDESITCPQLKVHSSNMKSKDSEKYLGDFLSKECSNKTNIASK